MTCGKGVGVETVNVVSVLKHTFKTEGVACLRFYKGIKALVRLY